MRKAGHRDERILGMQILTASALLSLEVLAKANAR